MPRKSRPSHASVSLFPFLSILACIIGVLTLVIAGLAVEPPAVAEEPEQEEDLTALVERSRLKTETEEDARRLSRLEAEIDEAEASARASAEELRRAGEAVESRKAQSATAHREEENRGLREKVDGSRRRLEEESRLLASLEKEKLAAEREAAASAEKAAAESVGLRLPAGGKRLTPKFIECTAKGLILDPDLGPDRERRVPVSWISTNTALKAFFKDVKGRDGWTVIFLIRPGGVEAFDAALSLALKENVRHGYLPVPGQRRIDFESLKSEGGNPSTTE